MEAPFIKITEELRTAARSSQGIFGALKIDTIKGNIKGHFTQLPS